MVEEGEVACTNSVAEWCLLGEGIQLCAFYDFGISHIYADAEQPSMERSLFSSLVCLLISRFRSYIGELALYRFCRL